MRGYLARGILCQDVTNLLRRKQKESGGQAFNGLIQYIEMCDVFWENLGSGYAATYFEADDPRLEKLAGVVDCAFSLHDSF